MILTYKRMNWNFTINCTELTAITIENPHLLLSFVKDLDLQLKKIEEKFMLTEDSNKMELHKEADLILSPLDLNYDKRSMQKGLFADLLNQMQISGIYEDIAEANAQIMQKLDTLDLQVDYYIDFTEIGISDIFKLFDVRIKTPEGSFVEMLTEYMRTIKRFTGKNLPILSNTFLCIFQCF